MNNFTNALYYGDNLKILRKYIPDESVDLIYLDPPFNSKRAYNVIFKDKTGEDASAQISAFEDTWHWSTDTEKAFREIIFRPEFPPDLKQMMQAFRTFMKNTFGKENDLLAYLTMMAVRLVEMHRVLKDIGSIYLHCDPTASHYLKIMMDQIFGVKNYRAEISWLSVTDTGSSKARAKTFPRMRDIILLYSKSRDSLFIQQFNPYSEKYLKGKFKGQNDRGVFRWQVLKTYSEETFERLKKEGRLKKSPNSKYWYYKQYLSDSKGIIIGNDWDDIKPLGPSSNEALGFPTQKPQALLERIIQASTNEADVVMDPFCGCGTAVAAAEKLGRKWIGIDITHLAISLIKKRMKDHFPDVKFDVIGEPESLEAAKELASMNKFQFEAWAVSLIGGQPYKSKGGSDRGVDGLLYFMDFDGEFHRIIIQVKGGGYHLKDVKELKSTIDAEDAPLGVLIVIKQPTQGMLSYAASLGTWQMPGSLRKYPVLQIFTVEDYFNDIRPELPDTSMTLKKAKRELRVNEKLTNLPLDTKFDE